MAYEKAAALAAEIMNPANRTIADAAAAAGISVRHAYRLKESTEYRAIVSGTQSQLIDELTSRLIAGLPKAERVFIDVMDDPGATTTARLRAAEGYTELALRLFETRTLEQRISAIEVGIVGGSYDTVDAGDWE